MSLSDPMCHGPVLCETKVHTNGFNKNSALATQFLEPVLSLKQGAAKAESVMTLWHQNLYT